MAKLRHVQQLSQQEGVNLEGIRRILALEEQVDALQGQVERLNEMLQRIQSQHSASRIFTAESTGAVHHGRVRIRRRLALPSP